MLTTGVDRRFFSHYSSHLPILEPSSSPNSFYDKCPFLFWAIVTIGSRRYVRDPSVFPQLSRRVLKLGFESVAARRSPIQLIQALLLLSAWPLPVKYRAQDSMPTLTGLALQLALQIGLHVTGVGQDFAREQVQYLSTEQTNRATLWRYCTIVCQRYVDMTSPSRPSVVRGAQVLDS